AHAPAEPSEGEHAERDPKDGADRAEYALHSRVVVPERVAEPGQESAPGGDSEGAIEGEDGEVHAGDPGGQRNERAKAGDEATEQHGDRTPPAQPCAGTFDVSTGDGDPLAVAIGEHVEAPPPERASEI